MTHATLQVQIAEQIFRLKQSGHQVVLVHGGGPFINRTLEKANIQSQFVEGQRVTSPEAFEEIQKTLIGEVNTGKESGVGWGSDLTTDYVLFNSV